MDIIAYPCWELIVHSANRSPEKMATIFADALKIIFFYENYCTLIRFEWFQINKKLVLVNIWAWCQTGNKPLSDQHMLIGIGAWVSNCMHSFPRNVITHPHLNFHSIFAKLLFKLRHGWWIISLYCVCRYEITYPTFHVSLQIVANISEPSLLFYIIALYAFWKKTLPENYYS